MDISIIGGGPSGLFFAKLLKRAYPDWTVRLYEQNARNSTYGFGIGLLGQSLAFIQRTDPELLADIKAAARAGSSMGFVHRGETVYVDVGVEGSSVTIERMRLINLLQDHCEELGVELHFETAIDDIEAIRRDSDVLVGADGVNSRVRKSYQDAFGASVEEQKNLFAWYATEAKFDPALMIFEQTDSGLQIVHAYQYLDNRSGFVVECDPETWRRAGFDKMSDADAKLKHQETFAAYLNGCELLAGNLTWFRPSIVKNKHWSHENVVLIGDAVRTVHPSIGSGTRVGMRDASVLVDAFVEHGDDLSAVFSTYKNNRQFSSDLFQRAAIQSIRWYETLEDRLHFDPVTLAFSYMLRTGMVDYARLRKADPAFVRRYETAALPFVEEGAR